MATIQFFHNGCGLAFPKIEVPEFMERAVLERGIDHQDLADIALRLINDEDAREMFFDLTDLEVVLCD